MKLGHSQNHLAVAGGCAAFWVGAYGVPTRYREVVLTVSKYEKRSAAVLHSSSVVGESKELEVEPEDKLHWPAAGIVRRRNILISRRDQSEVCSGITRCLQTKIGPSQFWIVNC